MLPINIYDHLSIPCLTGIIGLVNAYEALSQLQIFYILQPY